MNPTGYQPSRVSALPLLLPGQSPCAKKTLSPVSSAVRQMLFDSPQQRVPIAWSFDEWHCFVRLDGKKGNG